MNNSTPEKEVPQEPTKMAQVIDTLKYIVLALIIVYPIRVYVAQPFIVDGRSMYPTFEDKEYLIVNETVKLTQDYHRGDPVILHYPDDPSRYFIKRLVGLPGETITVKNGVTTISGPTHKESIILPEPYVRDAQRKLEDNVTRTLGPDEFFVMGDNRRESYDSRYFGVVPRGDMDGHPVLRLFPFSTFAVNPGALTEFGNPYPPESARK